MLHGIDVSEWQARTPSLARLSFAFARATYADRPDIRYVQHAHAFRAAFLWSGAYAFGVGAAQASIAAQAAAFLIAAGRADLLVLDVEPNWLIRPDGTKYLGPTMTTAEAAEFVKLVHARRRWIGLYHSRSGFPDCGQDFNWIAQWTTTAPTGIPWSFWQTSGVGLDRDLFNGDLAALRRLAGLTPPAGGLTVGALLRFSGPTTIYARLTSSGYIGAHKTFGIEGLAIVVNELLVPHDPARGTGGSFWRMTSGAAAGWLVSTSDPTIVVTGGHI